MRTDPLIAFLWGMQTVIASGTYRALALRPKRAQRTLQVGFALSLLGMIRRMPHAVGVSGMSDVDLHALTVGIVLALLVGQMLFAPRAARAANWTSAGRRALVENVAEQQVVDLCRLDHVALE